MKRRGLIKFLSQFDRDPDLLRRFMAEPDAALRDFDVSEEEAAVLVARDIVTLYRWGINPLLIRNFCGDLKINYVSVYKEAGL